MLERETLPEGIVFTVTPFHKGSIDSMRLCAITLFLISCVAVPAMAQTSPGTLRGRVTDPSGAVVFQATVTATGPDGKSAVVATDHQGNFQFTRLAPGLYNVTVEAKGFAVDQEAAVSVTSGQTQQLDVALQIQVEQQHVEVQEEAPTVSVSPENSASTLVLKGKDLDALSDDPDELASELQALAGPFRRSQRWTALHRRFHRRAASSQVVDPRDSHQPKSFFRRI